MIDERKAMLLILGRHGITGQDAETEADLWVAGYPRARVQRIMREYDHSGDLADLLSDALEELGLMEIPGRGVE